MFTYHRGALSGSAANSATSIRGLLITTSVWTFTMAASPSPGDMGPGFSLEATLVVVCAEAKHGDHQPEAPQLGVHPGREDPRAGGDDRGPAIHLPAPG